MVVETSRSGGVLIVTIIGRVDSVTAPKLQIVMDGVVAQGERRIAVDLKAMEFISSAGLRILLMTAKQMKTLSGKLSFGGASAAVLSLLKMSGFLAMLTVKPTLAEAVAAV